MCAYEMDVPQTTGAGVFVSAPGGDFDSVSGNLVAKPGGGCVSQPVRSILYMCFGFGAHPLLSECLFCSMTSWSAQVFQRL
jgi:hypothetical protein